MIHIFLGTKAQLIKMAPIMKELQSRNIEYNFIFSGQHQETIDELRANFGIKKPDIILHNGDDITSIPKMLIWSLKLLLYTVFNKKQLWQGDKKGVVLNHGDTFSTLLGSLLAKVSGHKNAHIESGLRSFKLLHPFPEEITRLIVFRLTDYFFAPDECALRNLEKYSGEKINTCGNTLYDSLQIIKRLPPPNSSIIPDSDYAIVSLHRFENLYKKEQIEKLINLLELVAKVMPLLFILHKPTKNRLKELGLLDRILHNANIETRPRYDYLRFIFLVSHSKFVITDGGSNQEECYYLGKPCLLFRNATERQEGLGKNALLSKFEEIKVLDFVSNYAQYEQEECLFDNTPSQQICDHLRTFT